MVPDAILWISDFSFAPDFKNLKRRSGNTGNVHFCITVSVFLATKNPFRIRLFPTVRVLGDQQKLWHKHAPSFRDLLPIPQTV